MGDGWHDMVMTFAEDGVAPPPIPPSLRGQMKVIEDRHWATTDQLGSLDLYLLQPVMEDLRGDDLGDYAAVVLRGFYVGEHYLTVSIRLGALTVLVHGEIDRQFSHVIGDRVDVATKMAALRRLVDVFAVRPCDDGRRFLVAVSPYRDVDPLVIFHPDGSEEHFTEDAIASLSKRLGAGFEAFDATPFKVHDPIDHAEACQRFILACKSPR